MKNYNRRKEIGGQVRDSGLAHGAYRPLFVDESFARQLGVRSAGAAHKNMEAPRRFETSGFLVSQT